MVRADGRTDGRAGGRVGVYGHVITKFSRMGSLPHFLTHGAPQARSARQSSALTDNDQLVVTLNEIFGLYYRD